MVRAHGFARRSIDEDLQGQVVPGGKFGRMFSPNSLEPPSDEALYELGELGKTMIDTQPLSQDGDNKTVPAGYVYLGQFIAHDITFDPTSLQETLVDPLALRNFRTPRLDLDSIYGAGPVGQPYLYARDPGPTRFTSDRFLIGKTKARQGSDDPTLRTQLPFDLPRGPEGFALIADPRNDENLIVAQMHLAFLRFHNRVLAKLPRDIPLESRFAEARESVIWHYQWIVLHDFLDRLLDPAQLAYVLNGGREFYRPEGEPFIPVEFSAAAYRFGHSMVREEYDYNRLFTFGKEIPASLDFLFKFTGLSGDGTGAPIPSAWIIDWRRFFELAEDVKVGYSRRLDPFLARSLHTIPGMPAPRSLAVRNLRRGRMLGLPSGQMVAQTLHLPTLTPEEISQGRDGESAKKYGFDTNTPLWYYVLKEAQVRGGGQRLGPVGSRIVAEVFVGLLQLDSESFLARNPLWTPTLPSKQENHFTMADLLAFTGDLNPIDDPRYHAK